jgi:uncharacterized protein YbjT (DUF2867 family)
MSATRVLVVGATGTQGGAVVDHLLSGDHGEFTVHAMTRDAASDTARALADRGAIVVEGDLTEKATLVTVMDDVDAVFGMTDYWTSGGRDGEFRQGANLAAAAEEAGVEHLVFSSIENCDEQPGVPVVDVKYDIEQQIAATDVSATVLRAHSFMQNFEMQRASVLEEGTLAMGLDEDVALRFVDVDDIGAVAAEAFAHQEEYEGRTLELASDEHTLRSAANVFSDVLGRDVRPVHLPIDTVRKEMGEDYAKMFEWFNDRSYDTDLGTLQRTVDTEFTPLEAYLRRTEWEG